MQSVTIYDITEDGDFLFSMEKEFTIQEKKLKIDLKSLSEN